MISRDFKHLATNVQPAPRSVQRTRLLCFFAAVAILVWACVDARVTWTLIMFALWLAIAYPFVRLFGESAARGEQL